MSFYYILTVNYYVKYLIKNTQLWKPKNWCFQKKICFGTFIHVLSSRQQKHQFLCFHYWDFLTNLWRNNRQSIFDVVEMKKNSVIHISSFHLNIACPFLYIWQENLLKKAITSIISFMFWRKSKICIVYLKDIATYST